MNKRLRALLTTLTIIGLSATAQSTLAAPTLINGSLTGPIANGSVPTGWTVLAPSPDTMNQFNNVGVPGLGAFGATPSASPDGGTWVGFADNGSNFFERFGQTVSGFAIGTAYIVSWYQANFGYTGGYTTPDSIGLSVDGVLAGLSNTSLLASGWTLESVQFTATSATHLLGFGLGGAAGQSYMSIDGISLAEVSSVPEPASLALLGLGLAGLGFSRRKKA